ncbi:hypothetical protein FALCPG4_004966 [Fusarium falciforme]
MACFTSIKSAVIHGSLHGRNTTPRLKRPCKPIIPTVPSIASQSLQNDGIYSLNFQYVISYYFAAVTHHLLPDLT